MNKYQIALESFYGSVNNKQYFIYYKKLLQELVEKATPKKAYCIHVEYSYCPNCHNSMSYDYNDKPMYCRNCGQALDWSDEE